RASCPRRPPRARPFPYTPLFRSRGMGTPPMESSVENRSGGPSKRDVIHSQPLAQPLASSRNRDRTRSRRNSHGHHGRRRTSGRRSEEHTSELQSREKLVCRLLLG